MRGTVKGTAAFTLWLVLSPTDAPAQPASAPSYENLNALVWTQRSAEYEAISLQTFRIARSSLQAALAQPTWTAAVEQQPPYRDLPPAIILDLDETVLDNTAFRVKLLRENLTYSDARWQEWVHQSRALPLPGAVEFLSYAHSEGVALFYVTNRVCTAASPADPTVSLLQRLQFPFVAAHLLCRANDQAPTNKSPRRLQVAATHRVVLLLGDDLNDFVAVPTGADVKDRLALRSSAVRAHQDKWGVKWLVLPNPMYGSWERALGDTVPQKLEALRP